VIAEPRSLIIDNSAASQDPTSYAADRSTGRGVHLNFDFGNLSGGAPNEEGGFNTLLEEIKRMQEENESLKAQIGQLQESGKASEAKAQQKHVSLVRSNEQLKKEQEKFVLLEHLVGDYKDILERV
jgi:hypothetical protein